MLFKEWWKIKNTSMTATSYQIAELAWNAAIKNKGKMEVFDTSWKVWFMFDNHTFKKIDTNDKLKAFKQIRDCFSEDPCGEIFVRTAYDESIKTGGLCADWKLHGKYIVTDEEILTWLINFYDTKAVSEVTNMEVMI